MENKKLMVAGAFIATIAIALLALNLLSNRSETKALPTHHITEASPNNVIERINRHGIAPIPLLTDYRPELAIIGWSLFRDPNLSSNNQVSCETCHDLQSNGAEDTAVSSGVDGQGIRNSLTVFNTALNYRFFWDGRANSLNEQLDGPIHSVVEMDSSWKQIGEYLSRSQHYAKRFSQAGIEISTDNIKAALVEFMKSLTTPNAPFDQYLRGDQGALTKQQIRGWNAFQTEGCVRCHRGTNIGGEMVIRFGFFGDDTTGDNRSSDTGRHLHTAKQEDIFLFRVASLRNVALTAPYFHDGRTESLEEAIRIMAESQLGRQLDDSKISDIKAFLLSLTGERPNSLKEFENEQN